MAYTQQPKTIGSMYLNVPKAAPQGDRDTLADILTALGDIKAYLSISLKNESGGYDRYTGFVNTYKKSEKDADIVIRASTVAQTPSKAPAKSRFQARRVAPQARETNVQEDEGFPL